MTLLTVAIAALCMGLGAFVQGAIGFGFGIVSLSIMGMLLDVRDASVMIAPAGLTLNAVIIWKLLPHFKWDRITGVLFGVVLGAPLGVLFLKGADKSTLQLVLGIVLILAVVQGSITRLERHRWHPWAIGLPCGLFSGSLSGAFGTGGPPLVAYVRAQRFDRLRYAATVQVLLGVAGVIRIEELVRQGLLTAPLLKAAGAGAVLAVAGAGLGISVLHRLPEKKLRRIVAAFLLVMGLLYIGRFVYSTIPA